MNSEKFSRLAKIAFRTGQGSSNKTTLNSLAGVIVKYSLLEHFFYKAVQLIPQAALSFLEIDRDWSF